LKATANAVIGTPSKDGYKLDEATTTIPSVVPCGPKNPVTADGGTDREADKKKHDGRTGNSTA